MAVRDLDLEFPPKPEYVGVARHVVGAVARLRGASEEVVEDVKLALSETCTNAVTAHVEAGRDDPVEVHLDVVGGTLMIEVADRGKGIDPALATMRPEFSSGEHTFEKGLSLPLVRSLVEDLEVVDRDGGGTIVRMRVAGKADRDPNRQ